MRERTSASRGLISLINCRTFFRCGWIKACLASRQGVAREVRLPSPPAKGTTERGCKGKLERDSTRELTRVYFDQAAAAGHAGY